MSFLMDPTNDKYFEEKTNFQKLCTAVLGRTTLRAEWPWQSSVLSFTQIFSDFQLMCLPWWKIGKLSGIFFFRDHLLLNLDLMSCSLGETKENLLKALQKEKFEPRPVPSFLADIVLSKDKEDWVLVPIETKPEYSILIDLLHKMRCPSIYDFQLESEKTPIATNFSYNYFEQCEIEIDNEMLEKSMASFKKPGLYYQSLIQDKICNVSTEPKCWLYYTPDDLQ